MNRAVEQILGGFAAAIVEISRQRPRSVVVLCVVLALGSIYLAATTLEVDTDADRILSADLPVRQTNIALAEAFPETQNNLIVMVEADDGGDARDAVEELAEMLAEHPERYPEIFLPGDAPYYEDFGLYYLDREDLDDLAQRVADSGPLLATLVERPELPILLGALTHVIGDVEGLDGLGEDGLQILEHLSLAVERFNQGGRAPIVWEDLLFEDLGADHDERQLLFVRPAGDLSQLEPVIEALADVRARARELEPRPGLHVRITGDRAVHTEEMSLVIHEAILAGTASLVLVALILYYSLNSFRLMIATLLTLIVGLAWTAGLATVAVGHLNALTSAFAVLYIGLGVDFGIHFALGYLEQLGLGKSPRDALRDCGAGVGSSLVFCALTTAIGFYAFIPTAYSGVADMGIISGSGVFLGLIATLTLYPALITLGLGESKKLTSSPLLRLQTRLPTFPLRLPRTVCGVAIVVTLVCCTSLAWVRFDTNTLNVRDPRVESVQALKDLLNDSDLSAWTIDVLTKDLEEAGRAAEQIEALDGIHQVNTALSFLPEDQAVQLAIFDQMRSDLEAPIELTEEETGEEFDRMTALEYTIEGYGVALDIDAELRGDEGDDDPILLGAERLREALLILNDRLEEEVALTDVDALEEDVFGELPGLLDDIIDALPTRTVSLEDLPSDLLVRYLAPDGRARVEVFSDFDLEQPGALERFSDLVHSVRPDAGGPAAGTVALGRAIVTSLQQALATAFVVITLLLILLWRSLKYMLITLTPLMVGAAATAAVSVSADIHFNFANIIVLPLILGIGVDSGIHLVHRHRRGLLGADNLLATSTARAVLFSALTTVASFATLAFSNHLGISSLGQMLTVGILMMLVANLVVLPAILTLVDGKSERRGS